MYIMEYVRMCMCACVCVGMCVRVCVCALSTLRFVEVPVFRAEPHLLTNLGLTCLALACLSLTCLAPLLTPLLAPLNVHYAR